MGGDGEPSREATPSPGRHNLWSGKQPLREVPAAKKKRKATTPPHKDGGISIRDSLPRKRRSYIGGPESDDEDEQEDGETLEERAARKSASARPPPATERTSSVRSAEQRRSPGRQAHGPADQTIEAVPEPERREPGLGKMRPPAWRPWGRARCPHALRMCPHRPPGQEAPVVCARSSAPLGGQKCD